MIPSDLQKAGLLVKSHGKDGTMILKMEDDFDKDLKNGDFCFISIDETKIPFLIDEIRWSASNLAFVNFTDISSYEETASLKGKTVYLSFAEKKENLFVGEFTGYILKDQNSGREGVVTGFSNQAQNPLLYVVINQKEYILPFHEHFIIKSDSKSKKLIVNLPDGIFDL